MKPESFHAVFDADLPARESAVLAASQRPFAAAAFGEPVAKSAPASLPKYAIVATGDKAIAPAAEEFMAERAGAHIVKVKGASHLVAVSEPGTVTKLIEKAAH